MICGYQREGTYERSHILSHEIDRDLRKRLESKESEHCLEMFKSRLPKSFPKALAVGKTALSIHQKEFNPMLPFSTPGQLARVTNYNRHVVDVFSVEATQRLRELLDAYRNHWLSPQEVLLRTQRIREAAAREDPDLRLENSLDSELFEGRSFADDGFVPKKRSHIERLAMKETKRIMNTEEMQSYEQEASIRNQPVAEIEAGMREKRLPYPFLTELINRVTTLQQRIVVVEKAADIERTISREHPEIQVPGDKDLTTLNREMIRMREELSRIEDDKRASLARISEQHGQIGEMSEQGVIPEGEYLRISGEIGQMYKSLSSGTSEQREQEQLESEELRALHAGA